MLAEEVLGTIETGIPAEYYIGIAGDSIYEVAC